MFEEEYSHYWKTIVDTMMDGLMVVDPEGVIVSINKAMETITGYSKDELVGQSCAILDCDVCFGTRAEGHDKYCALFKEFQRNNDPQDKNSSALGRLLKPI